MEGSEKKIKWQALVFMCFSTLWGFGNVLNGYIYFHGTQVIFSWILMFALYFVPYALMVGELGSTLIGQYILLILPEKVQVVLRR